MMYIDQPGKDFDYSLAMMSKLQIIGVDTETNGLDPHSNNVLLLQMGNENEQFVYNVYTLQKYLQPIFNLLTNENIIKVLHNAYFDYKMILGSFNVRMKNIACTMLAEQLITKGKVSSIDSIEEDTTKNQVKRISASLAAVADKYLGVKLDKSQQTTFIDQPFNGLFDENQIKYAGLDIKYLASILNKQHNILENMDMLDLVQLEFDAIASIAEMSYNGIYLDRRKWLALLPATEENIKKYAAELDTYFATYATEEDKNNLFQMRLYELNYDSSSQMKDAINGLYGLNLTDTNAATLESISKDIPAAACLIKYRQAKKIQTTYGKKFLQYINPNTGRIHSDFKQIHADTGRMSSANPNMQNIPKQQEFRTPFCVEDPVNYRFISADFSGKKSTY